ncbi:hypothetical protein DFH28DRAFT_934631 [Melampsora americana]|nr:hypothetical protein DFH28DRAFT_934631 [Melampsora americana]
MALPGEEVTIPVKRTKRPRRLGAASQRLAKQNASGIKAAESITCNSTVAPTPSNVGLEQDQHSPTPDQYRALVVDDQPDEADDAVVYPYSLSSDIHQYYRSVTYQERTLREEAAWQAVIPKLFIAFMPCSKSTYQWADNTLWHHDWNISCRCSEWQKRAVHVDVIDLTGRHKLQLVCCDCTSDLVRLIRLGYMGGTPTRPRIAFSCRLLRFHHILWKYTSVRMAPFVEALDEFLDARSPLLLVAGSDDARDWRKTFSAAVDAFREMLRLKDELATRALRLSPIEELASNCPTCFGPTVPGKRPNEPDFFVCLDANFQQRRHLAASALWRGETGVLPSLFMEPNEVMMWQKKMEPIKQHSQANQVEEEVIDPCSTRHTAANDTRGRQTWRGCDETGLMGMACCHDHLLKFINIVQSGERGYYLLAMLDWILRKTTRPDQEVPRFGILYDIGCNMEKSIIKVNTSLLVPEQVNKHSAMELTKLLSLEQLQRNLFHNERRAGRLKFGTSVFHSYVHEWACQLKYNPRLNKDWGLSDGEAHRLCALNLRARHTNQIKRKQSISWLAKRLISSAKLYGESKKKLNALRTKNARYSEEYLKSQWNRQRDLQLRAIVQENSQVLATRIPSLVDLEDKQRDAELRHTHSKRPRNRTAAEKRKIANLQETIIIVEEEIQEVVGELGGNHYRDIPGARTPKGRRLIRIRVAKSKLYGAMVDVHETQLRNDERQGTRMQQRSKKMLRDKQATLKSKYTTYKTNVDKFNTEFPSADPIVCPVLEDIKKLQLADPFWDIGQLTHPNEAWATDEDTKVGIRAYLEMTHAHDELRRVGREVRQAIKWALVTQEKLSVLKTALECQDLDPNTIGNKWLAELVGLPDIPGQGRLGKSRAVLSALFGRLSQEHARLWMLWNSGLIGLMEKTKVYVQLPEEEESTLRMRWVALVAGSRLTWRLATEAEIIEATPLDEGEAAKLGFDPEDDNGGDIGDDEEDGPDLMDLSAVSQSALVCLERIPHVTDTSQSALDTSQSALGTSQSALVCLERIPHVTDTSKSALWCVVRFLKQFIEEKKEI